MIKLPETAQISKKQLFFILRPDCARINTKVLQQFFTTERMQRIGIDPDQYKRIRTFSIDQTKEIKRELRVLLDAESWP